MDGINLDIISLRMGKFYLKKEWISFNNSLHLVLILKARENGKLGIYSIFGDRNYHKGWTPQQNIKDVLKNFKILVALSEEAHKKIDDSIPDKIKNKDWETYLATLYERTLEVT